MPTRTPTHALRPEKRDAILRAARKVFAAMGFTRATIDAIAAEAQVSTRTLYKHFRNKNELFATVLVASAAAVADDYEASVREGIGGAETPQERLLVLARAATKQSLGHPEHFAMMRQVESEGPHLPAEAVAAWRKAGPDRVEKVTVAQLRALDKEGALEIANPRRAARHFLALTTAELRSGLGRKPLTGKAADRAIVAGVEVFTRGYAPR